MSSMLDKIRARLQEDIDKEKLALLEEVEIELTEEEKEGLSEEEIEALIEAKKAAMKEKEEDEDDEDDDDDDEVDVKESLKKIFSSVELDEKVKSELETLFDVVVNERVTKKCAELTEKYEAEFTASIEKIEESIDKYISYAADEWLKENELAVEKGIRMEISENIITGLRDLFVENYIDVPEDKVDIVEEAEETIEELTKKLDEAKNDVLTLHEEINTMKSQKIVDELAEDLTETEKEKLSGLISEIKYEDDTTYKEKITLVVEKYFKTDDKTKDTPIKIDERMQSYMKHFKK